MSQIIEWINEKIIINENDKIEIRDIDYIRDFTLLWNLYEALYSNGDYSLREALQDIKDKKDIFDEHVIEPIFVYYHERYQDTTRLERLSFRHSGADQVAKVKLDNMLQSISGHSKSDKLYFIMAIVYRYRNNLFHGQKQIVKIRYQEENFKYANQFLMHIIEKYQREYDGY